ncbi:MAG TPA: lantibiotic dehydratase [Mycobacteriales bacterium]|nr:lantibiotic dehydratase [Mycobacteriales bacterium]
MQQPNQRRLFQLMSQRRLLGYLQKLWVTGHSGRRGMAISTPFRVGDPRQGMARVPLLPDEDPEPEAPEPVVAEGMFISSEVNADSSPERAGRRRVTARAYQIRARRRTTPQGVFAAVAELRVADIGTVLTVGDIQARSYPSPVWLHEMCDRALDCPGALRGLTFTANNLAVRRGDRLEVERPTGNTLTGTQRASVRITEAVDMVMDVCRSGASWHQCAAALARKRPNVPDEAVDSVLRTLARNGFMLTDLTPEDPCNDPIGHVLARLPQTNLLRRELSRLRATLAEADAHPPGHPARRTALENARKLTDDMASVWRPVCVDTAHDAPIRISKNLTQQVARAAGVLWRLAPAHDRLADWHQRFLHRYGAQRLVPLLDACDPVTGLGCDIEDTDRPLPTETTGALAGLLIGTLTSGEVEVRLDAATIEALDRRAPGDRPEPSIEVYARVVAASTRDRDEGNFILAITGSAAPAGSTRARFTGLLPTLDVDVDAGHGTMPAELVFQPLSYAAAALTGRANSASWRIPIGTISHPGDLLVQELAVISDGHRLCLWSTRHQRPVRPVHRNRLGHHLMPPLAGFLCLVGQHGSAPMSLWTWAPFDGAPFLPRVRCHGTILASARWRLPEVLRRAAGERTTWANALHDWRTSTRPVPPKTIVVDDTDRQLPLNLDRNDDCELLRRYVARGVAAVTESPGGCDAVPAVVSGPSGYHGLEIVVPLAADSDSAHVLAPSSPMYVRGTGEGLFLPGGQWLSLAVDASVSTQHSVLERIVATARDDAGLWDRWFWLRYTTVEHGPHLRVRFHGEPVVLGGQLLPVLRQACARLMAEGLSGGFAVEPYDREIERYGGHEAIEAAEMIFHHDSELAAAILAPTADAEERIALTAVSAAEIARIVADSDRRALAPYRLERGDRRIQARVRPHCRALDDAAPPHHELWKARASALRIYRCLLPLPRRVDCASSLIHMHANRMLGDNHQERIARALAADLIARRIP